MREGGEQLYIFYIEKIGNFPEILMSSLTIANILLGIADSWEQLKNIVIFLQLIGPCSKQAFRAKFTEVYEKLCQEKFNPYRPTPKSLGDATGTDNFFGHALL